MPGSPDPGTARPRTLPGKPPEVEELVDEHLHRPLARRLVTLLVRTPISPNQVTLLSALVGIASGVALALGALRPGWRIVAGLLLMAAVVLDCADGQLARARGTSSTYGGILDGVADYAVGLAVGIGASLWTSTVYGSRWWWLLGAAGTASSAVQSALFDHAKTRYISRVGRGYTERDENFEALRQERDQAWRERRFRDAALLWLYLRYTAAQHALLTVPVADPDAYRARHAARMRAWTFLGIGTHFALGYVLAMLSYWWPPALPGYFLISATVLNGYLLVMMALERRAAR